MSVPVHDPFGVRNDPDMPFLARATDPDDVERRLAALFGSTGPRVVAVRVVRYKPGRRCLIEYDVEFQRPEHGGHRTTILGKARARGSPGAADRLLRHLRSRGFDSDSEDGIAVPEPLGIVDEYRMSLQRKVPGVSATVSIAAEGSGPLARKIAEAICKLHHAGALTRRVHTTAEEIRILRECLARVAVQFPEWERRLERVLRECTRLAGDLPTGPSCGIHRDFYSDQVIVEGARLCLVDFDLYCEGDPALDAGNFLGHVTEQSVRLFGRADALEESEHAFEERFLELSGRQTGRSVRVFATLTLARHVFLSTRFPERRPFTRSLLELCEQRLDLGACVGARVAFS